MVDATADAKSGSGMGECNLCHKNFNILLRRPYRCLNCQNYFCQSCSPHRIKLSSASGGSFASTGNDRACSRCFVQLMDDPEKNEDENATVASAIVKPSPTKEGGSSGGGDGVKKTPYEQIEEQYPRYTQMLKMGVQVGEVSTSLCHSPYQPNPTQPNPTQPNPIQRDAVAQKMQADDVNPHHVRIFKAGPGGDAAAATAAASSTATAASGGRRPSKRRSSMRQVYWDTLDENRANLSVFGPRAEAVSFSAEEIVRMQELFGQDEAPASVVKGKKKAKAKTITILDSRRAANVSIMLKQFQSLLKVLEDRPPIRAGNLIRPCA